VRVVVGDDHPVYRDGVVRALDASDRTEVVAAVGDGRAVLDAIREHAPDVALLDYKMPGIDEITVAHAVVRDKLATRVLLLSASTEGSVVYRAIRDGAAGYLSKEADRDDIVAAVVACARGEDVLPRVSVSGLTAHVRQHAQGQPPHLSDRERQILQLIADGKSVPDMAAELYLAQTTIKTHIRRLCEKLSVGSWRRRGARHAQSPSGVNRRDVFHSSIWTTRVSSPRSCEPTLPLGRAEPQAASHDNHNSHRPFLPTSQPRAERQSRRPIDRNEVCGRADRNVVSGLHDRNRRSER